MDKISHLTEQLMSEVVVADANDLQTLAQMHTGCQELQQALRDGQDSASPALPDMTRLAETTEKLISAIILREVDDGTASLKQVTEQIKQLQSLVERAASGASAPQAATTPATPSAPATPPTPQPAAAPMPGGIAMPSDDPVVLKADDLPLVVEFIGEATEHISTAEVELLKIDDAGDNDDSINAIFRSFHTIKGVAGFLNLKHIQALAHCCESLLDLARKGKLRLKGGPIDLVFESVDMMKALVALLDVAVKNNSPVGGDPKLAALIVRLQTAVQGGASATPATPVTPPISPTPASPRAADAVPTQSTPAPAPVVTPPAASAPVTATDVAKPSPAPAPAAPSTPAPGAPASATSSSSSDTTVKVATDRLDALINMVGELVIAQSMVAQDMSGMVGASQRLSRNMSHMGKISRELQELSMSMRMVPIQGVFQKMARMVHDLARKAGKEIEFETEGGETELDRNVVDIINDPLVHMIRNSVDHGIEMPGDREQMDKPRAGHVILKAYHQGGNIVIEINDDGAGLNKKKILKKALEAGLIRPGQELTEQEIFHLIFHPGLSTADKITEISGRGVGMDVVRRNIESMRGRIEITSVEGKGSTFTLRLPLTLAVIDGLVVKVGRERYIVPITSVEQSLRPQAQQISTVQDRGEMCMVRDSLLPLFRLYKLFGVKPTSEDAEKTLVVIVQDNDRRCCLMVDELLGQQQVVIKSLGEGIGIVPGISGGAILGDGDVSLILDVPGLIEMSTK